MNWSHVAVLIVAVVVGYWLGGKYPGAIAKVTGGRLS
jgi:hypothetical protein